MKPSDLTDEQLVKLVDGTTTFILEYEATGPGKFEGNANPGLTERIFVASHDTSWLDDDVGTSDGAFGWNGLIGKLILVENNQGFVSSYEYPSVEEARKTFDLVISDYEPYLEDAE